MKEKKTTLIHFINLIGISLLLTLSCKKDKEMQVPIVNTVSISDTTFSTAICNCFISSNGSSAITAKGVCWSTSPNPTINNNKTYNGGDDSNFSSYISNLTNNTTYYVRAYAQNSSGVGYGNVLSFKTKASAPEITTSDIRDTSFFSATCGGNITFDGGSQVTVRGVCWSTSPDPTIDNSKTIDGYGNGTFTSSVTGLTDNTIYYIRAYASNSLGTSYGKIIIFKTKNVLPTVSTVAVGSKGMTSALCGSSIPYQGASAILARGVCWSSNPNPTISDNKTTDGTGMGWFTSNIDNLSINTKYYVRAYATNNSGTVYGNTLSFTINTVNDIDGNIYHLITIGTQIWLLENLKTTRYQNGEKITYISDGIDWGNSTSGAYCDYGDDGNNSLVYGRLYNGYAITDSRNIAPAGFHVPSLVEWNTLINYLGGASIAAGKLKETGLAHWISPNTGADNSSGFTALPGGYRHPNDGSPGKMANLGLTCVYWTNNLFTINLQYNSGNVTIVNLSSQLANGFSVRCIKN